MPAFKWWVWCGVVRQAGLIGVVFGLLSGIGVRATAFVPEAGGCEEQHEFPAIPCGVVEEGVTFEAAGVTVHGTLARPEGEGRHPAVVLIAGSGPTDRDWNSPLLPGRNGSGRLLAHRLAQAGYVTLRYDKRGTGETGIPERVTWGDYIAEARAAVELLRGDERVDAECVFVAGHSEGGAHALRLAQESGELLRGVLLLSTAGRSLRDVVLWQIRRQLEQAGLDPESVDREIETFGAALDGIVAGEVVDASDAGRTAGVRSLYRALTDAIGIEFAREILAREPTSAFGDFDLPVLVLNGGKDMQVDPELDARPLAGAAEQAGRAVELVIAPNADHVLKHQELARDELFPVHALAYNSPTRDVDPEAVAAIIDWLDRHSVRGDGAE